MICGAKKKSKNMEEGVGMNKMSFSLFFFVFKGKQIGLFVRIRRIWICCFAVYFVVFLWKLKRFGGFEKNPKIKFKKCVWMCVNKEVFAERFVISCF